MTATWPPPPRPGDRFDHKRLAGRNGPSWVPCRLVRLWGRDVWVHDETGRVWCPDCLSLVDVDELGRADNRHAAVGLPPRTDGALLPMSDEPPARTSDGWDFDA